jgi:hypothetical protein
MIIVVIWYFAVSTSPAPSDLSIFTHIFGALLCLVMVMVMAQWYGKGGSQPSFHFTSLSTPTTLRRPTITHFLPSFS